MNNMSHIKYYAQICPKILRQIYNVNKLNSQTAHQLPMELKYNKKLELQRFDEHTSNTYTKIIEQEANYCNIYGYNKWIEKMLDPNLSDKSYLVKLPDFIWILNYNQVQNLKRKYANYKLNYHMHLDFIADLDSHSGNSMDWTRRQSEYIDQHGLKNWLDTQYAKNGYQISNYFT